MRVLVLGSTGFIGNHVTQAIARDGHIVLGQTRSQDKAVKLAADEIIPVVQETKDLSEWIDQYSDVDIIVDAVGGGPADYATGGPQRLRDIKAFAERVRPANISPPHPITYISISGTWLHGSSPDKIKTEGDPLLEPIEMLSWRPALDKETVSSQSASFSGIVVKAGPVYGKAHSLLGPLFASAAKGCIEWWGGPEIFASLVHVEDVASFVAAVVSKAAVLGGLTLDVAPYVENWGAIVSELKRVSGAKSVQWHEPSNPFQVALASDQRLNLTLGRDLLGWQAKKAPLAVGMQTYYDSYLANKSLA